MPSRSGRPLGDKPSDATANRRTPERIDTAVLAQLGLTNRPIGAYEIAERATAAGERMAPNQVYRALERLVDKGLVRRVETLSAYTLKQEKGDICLVCSKCQAIQVLAEPELLLKFARLAGRRGFRIEKPIIELHGHCRDCASSRQRA